MALHHLVHVSVSSSYLMASSIPGGIIIGLVHDVSDILIGACKGLHLAGYEWSSIVIFLLAQIIWFAMRLMGFPIIIYLMFSEKYD